MTRHKLYLAMAIFSFFFFAPNCAFPAEYNQDIKAKIIKKTTEAANGQKLTYPNSDSSEVTVAVVEIPAGKDTGWHTHPFPVYAYVLSGALTVEIAGGKCYGFKEGEAILEVIDTPHIGRNKTAGPVHLVVFYAGVQGERNTIEANDPTK